MSIVIKTICPEIDDALEIVRMHMKSAFSKDQAVVDFNFFLKHISNPEGTNKKKDRCYSFLSKNSTECSDTKRKPSIKITKNSNSLMRKEKTKKSKSKAKPMAYNYESSFIKNP